MFLMWLYQTLEEKILCWGQLVEKKIILKNFISTEKKSLFKLI